MPPRRIKRDEGRLSVNMTVAQPDLTGAPEEVPEARATVSLLAVRAATRLVLTTGSAAAVRGSHADRLVREAALLLVFAGRPRIKAAALERWARA